MNESENAGNEVFINQVRSTSKFITLFYLLPCVAVYLVLTFLLKLNHIATLFICVGLFNVLLLVGNYISVSKTEKNDDKVHAQVISCEKKKEYKMRGGRKCLQAEYYLVSFRMPGDCEEKDLEYITEKKMKTGSYVNIYINRKNGFIITEEELEECKATSGSKPMAFLIGICFFIAACIIVIPKIGGVVSSKGFWMMVFGYFVSITFIIIGCFAVKSSRSKSKAKFECRKIPAVLTCFVEKSSTDTQGSMSISYFPVFEYEINGETHSYQSSMSGSRKRREGSKTTIYLNYETGEVFEEHEIKASGKIGYKLPIVGAILPTEHAYAGGMEKI